MNSQIDLYKLNRKEFFKITISGHLDENSAISLAESLKVKMASVNNNKMSIIWNCETMTGYEPRARYVIQNIIKELKNNINRNYIITTNKIIQSGAMILSIFTSFDMKVVKSEDEIKE
jgi:hypothetical protein